MSSCQSHTCCLYVRGNLSWRDVPNHCSDTPEEYGPFVKVGEISTFGYTPQITKIGGQKSLSLEGGTTCTTTTFDGLQVSFLIRCASDSNLAVALFGDAGEKTFGTVVGETIDGNEVAPGAYVPLKYVGATNVVITSPAAAVLGVDYKITPAGIEIMEGTAVLTAGTNIVVDYQYGTQGRVEIGTKNSIEKELLFNGKDSEGNAVVLRLYRVSIAADGDVQWLNDADFMTFTLTGTALVDDSRDAVEFAPGLPRSTFGYMQRLAA
jgi:hypothetical protein